MPYGVLECDIVVTELHAYDSVIKGFISKREALFVPDPAFATDLTQRLRWEQTTRFLQGPRRNGMIGIRRDKDDQVSHPCPGLVAPEEKTQTALTPRWPSGLLQTIPANPKVKVPTFSLQELRHRGPLCRCLPVLRSATYQDSKVIFVKNKHLKRNLFCSQSHH